MAVQDADEFREKFRSHLMGWLRARQPARGGPTPVEGVPHLPAELPVAINGYKLFYHRSTRKLSFATLSRDTGLPVPLLKKLEVIADGTHHQASAFATCPRAALEKLEAVLECPGRLKAGQSDDFLNQYLMHYSAFKGERAPGPAQLQFKTKAVVFDFDGTMTHPDETRTTWERLWVALGYPIDDCFALHRRYSNGEFSHQEWCNKTRDAFRKGD